MRVVTGSTWETPMGSRHFEVELTSLDGETMWSEEWPGWDHIQRFKRLQVEADVLVVAYMAREGAIGGEYARERITDLRSRL